MSVLARLKNNGQATGRSYQCFLCLPAWVAVQHCPDSTQKHLILVPTGNRLPFLRFPLSAYNKLHFAFSGGFKASFLFSQMFYTYHPANWFKGKSKFLLAKSANKKLCIYCSAIDTRFKTLLLNCCWDLIPHLLFTGSL